MRHHALRAHTVGDGVPVITFSARNSYNRVWYLGCVWYAAPGENDDGGRGAKHGTHHPLEVARSFQHALRHLGQREQPRRGDCGENFLRVSAQRTQPVPLKHVEGAKRRRPR